MCLITEHTEPRVLDKDMVVYKKLRKTASKNIFISDVFCFQYVLNKLYETDMVVSDGTQQCFDAVATKVYGTAKERMLDSNNLISVSNGFHSAKNIKRYLVEGSFCRASSEVIVKCIIPKGSLIYEDATDLVASNKIIIRRVLSEDDIIIAFGGYSVTRPQYDY